MSKTMHSWSFLAEISLMRDVLDVLHHLSLYLQRRDASIIDAKEQLDNAIRLLEGLKSVNGMSLSELSTELEVNDSFHGLHVTHSHNEVENFMQMRKQFIQALIDNTISRFPAKEMLEAGAVLSPKTWPDNDDEKLFFGDKDVLRLAEIFRINKPQAVAEFRLFKNNSKHMGPTLSAFTRLTLKKQII